MSNNQLSIINFNGCNIKIPYNEDGQLICKCSWYKCKKLYTTLKAIKQYSKMAENTWKDPNDVSCSTQSKEQFYEYYQIYTMFISVVETTDSTTKVSSISEVSWIQIYLEFPKDCQQIKQENHIRPETIQ